MYKKFYISLRTKDIQRNCDTLYQLLRFTLAHKSHYSLVSMSLSCQASGEVRVYMLTSLGQEFHYALPLVFKITNNEAEYKVLVAGLSIVVALEVKKVKVQADYEVIMKQVSGKYIVNEEKLRKYLQVIDERKGRFQYFYINQVLKKKNLKDGQAGTGCL